MGSMNSDDGECDEAKQILVARPARVLYVDLCQHENVRATDFFLNAKIAYIEVYGLTIADEEFCRVLYYNDLQHEEDSSNGEGIVIPMACVKSIEYYTESEVKFDHLGEQIDGEIN